MSTAQRKALVIGAGSIGERHATLLEGLGLATASVSSRSDLARDTFTTVPSAVQSWRPDYVVVANETALHSSAFSQLQLAGFGGSLLVEKPLGFLPSARAAEQFHRVGVGFNLRFHPVLVAAKSLLGEADVYTVEAYAGQALDTWRPGRSPESQYSGSRERGGGVLRDLSHEIDYLHWLFGSCLGLFAAGGRIANVTADSDDAWGVVAHYEKAPLVTLQLNYLDTRSRRRVVINSSIGTIEIDLIASTLVRDGSVQEFATERDTTYLLMHQAMLGDVDQLATLDDGLVVEEVISMVEASATDRAWVSAA